MTDAVWHGLAWERRGKPEPLLSSDGVKAKRSEPVGGGGGVRAARLNDLWQVDKDRELRVHVEFTRCGPSGPAVHETRRQTEAAGATVPGKRGRCWRRNPA